MSAGRIVVTLECEVADLMALGGLHIEIKPKKPATLPPETPPPNSPQPQADE